MNKEEAMKILKDFHDKSALFSVRTALETLHPELKESEDEKIRKELIEHCRNTRCVTEEGAERIAKWLTWLEKQGEQKPNDMLAWSEEDEVLLSSVINSLLIFEDSGASKMKIDWLTSIKQRIKGE